MDIAFGPYGLTAKADASGVDLKVYVKDMPVHSDRTQMVGRKYRKVGRNRRKVGRKRLSLHKK